MQTPVKLDRSDLEVMVCFIEECLMKSRRDGKFLKGIRHIEKSQLYEQELLFSRIEEVILKLRPLVSPVAASSVAATSARYESLNL
jgi:hypothetical protein